MADVLMEGAIKELAERMFKEFGVRMPEGSTYEKFQTEYKQLCEQKKARLAKVKK